MALSEFNWGLLALIPSFLSSIFFLLFPLSYFLIHISSLMISDLPTFPCSQLLTSDLCPSNLLTFCSSYHLTFSHAPLLTSDFWSLTSDFCPSYLPTFFPSLFPISCFLFTLFYFLFWSLTSDLWSLNSISYSLITLYYSLLIVQSLSKLPKES